LKKFEPHSQIENISLTHKFYVNFYVPIILPACRQAGVVQNSLKNSHISN